jgi:hypothetical protein
LLASTASCLPTTPPTAARAVVNDIYRYELRLLRDHLVGEFSKGGTTTRWSRPGTAIRLWRY